MSKTLKPDPECLASIPTPREIVCREDARARGLKRFFTGEPCIRDHITERSVSSGGCLACTRFLKKKLYDENPEKYRALTFAYGERVAIAAKGFLETAPIECMACDKILPAEEFGRNKRRWNGRRAECRTCTAARWKRFQDGPNYQKRLKKVVSQYHELKRDDPKRSWSTMAKNALFVRSRKRGDPPPDIDVNWLYESAPDECPLLGIRLNYGSSKMTSSSAAVDRIDNNLGYSKANCWVISMRANNIKTNATIEEIEAVARNLRKALIKRSKEERDRDNEPVVRQKRVNPYAA